MNILVERNDLGDTYSRGMMYINSVFSFYTMEDKDRRLEVGGIKIQNETAIPRGIYPVIIDHSNRFGRDMPHITGVSGFSGVRIHAGNTSHQTEGCILLGTAVGRIDGEEAVLNSKAAFHKFFMMLEAAIDAGEEVTIEIR